MIGTINSSKFVALAVSSALATSALGGCTTNAAPRADLSAGKAQTALAKGQHGKAMSHAEAAVLAEPRNAAYRAMLGAAYLEAGRFHSAATSFEDALTLGDDSPRTALSLALAQVASGKARSARTVLNDRRDDLDPADLGLALALAGDASQGVHVLSNAIRSGSNTSKVRQNLAYAYALQGNWRSARLMAAEDISASKIDDRIAEWASTAAPEQFQQRVAKLLEVPLVGDVGQPAQLSLANNPSTQQLAAQAAATMPAPQSTPQPALAISPSGELPPVIATAEAEPAPTIMTEAAPANAPALVSVPTGDAGDTPAFAAAPAAQADDFTQAFAKPAPVPTGVTAAQMTQNAIRFVSQPMVQKTPERTRVASQKAAITPSQNQTGGDHMVQLGSFSSEKSAQRAIGIYSKRHANLNKYNMVISKARVKGKTYWRVAAGSMARNDARSMCSSVKARGYGCFAYSSAQPLPGAVETGVRMARR